MPALESALEVAKADLVQLFEHFGQHAFAFAVTQRVVDVQWHARSLCAIKYLSSSAVGAHPARIEIEVKHGGPAVAQGGRERCFERRVVGDAHAIRAASFRNLREADR